jgi:HEAT repeat protein
LLGCLTDQDENVRYEAVGVLADRQDPGVTEALLERLTDQSMSVWYAAVRVLSGREGPGVTEALLGCLTSQDWPVRHAAVEAMAGRKDPGITEALLERLTDQYWSVQRAAVKAIGERESPETLLILTRKVHALSQSSLAAVTEAAEPLMIRHYRQIDPADQPEVLAVMGWLTTAALSDSSK